MGLRLGWWWWLRTEEAELVGESRGSISGCFESSQDLLAWRQAELVAMIKGRRVEVARAVSSPASERQGELSSYVSSAEMFALGCAISGFCRRLCWLLMFL